MSSRPHAIPAVVAAVLLLVALGQHPYGYYSFLRWAVTIAAVVVAWVAWNSAAQWATWAFIGIASLFNPIAPVYLERETWRPIDVICAIGFAASLAIKRRAWQQKTQQPSTGRSGRTKTLDKEGPHERRD